MVIIMILILPMRNKKPIRFINKNHLLIFSVLGSGLHSIVAGLV